MSSQHTDIGPGPYGRDTSEGDVSGQPPPVHNESRPIWELVIKDMQARNEMGTAKYGTPLQAFNGRKSLEDLYDELLDAVVYLRQHLEEDRHE